MGLDEKGIGIGLHQRFQFHEMKGHLEQPLPRVPRMTLPVLPTDILHGTAVMGVSMPHTGGIQPTAELRDMEPNGRGP